MITAGLNARALACRGGGWSPPGSTVGPPVGGMSATNGSVLPEGTSAIMEGMRTALIASLFARSDLSEFSSLPALLRALRAYDHFLSPYGG